MAENDFKPFAVGAGANVLTQDEWEALVALSTGFTAGIARAGEINKALRQATVMASVLAQYIADTSGSDVLDDGDIGALVVKLKNTINSIIPDVPVASVNSKTGAVVLNASDVGAYSPENCPLPVGAILQMGNDTNPATIYPGTAWKDLAGDYSGRVISIGPAMETGGSNDVTLSADNLPDHKHKAGDQAPGGVWNTDVTHGTDNQKTASLGYTSETLKPDNTNVSNSSFSVRNAYVAFRTWMRTA
ncbi:hypothetical protein SB6413_06081 [Klebsiella pasteurii]|uniref:phage baseplate protein n=1 Tax=Klebsiella pasteurii TaxID=2587529 RepID=UPI00115C8F08|nr:hypothetical protein [Klebsiella pasteurii]VUT16878.1 hypothetical protein SB6413_06081 [Klebsiella pasteurii]